MKPTKHKEKMHLVKASLRVHELTKAGTSLELEVFGDGEKLGTIVIGQGSFTWYGGKKKTGRSINWTDFADIMNQECYA